MIAGDQQHDQVDRHDDGDDRHDEQRDEFDRGAARRVLALEVLTATPRLRVMVREQSLERIPLLIAIYSVTVVVAYALVCCMDEPALPQTGND